MISRTRSRIAASNPSRREPSWSTSLSVLVFTMAYSSCALNLPLRDSGLLLSMTSQENTPSTFLQESRQNQKYSAQEDFWIDPRLWPYYLKLVPRLPVRLYDPSLPDDNTPVRC